MTHTRGELFDPVFGGSAVAAEVSDHAWVVALLEVEAALSRAAATVGLVTVEHASIVTGVATRLAAPARSTSPTSAADPPRAATR